MENKTSAIMLPNATQYETVAALLDCMSNLVVSSPSLTVVDTEKYPQEDDSIPYTIALTLCVNKKERVVLARLPYGDLNYIELDISKSLLAKMGAGHYIAIVCTSFKKPKIVALMPFFKVFNFDNTKKNFMNAIEEEELFDFIDEHIKNILLNYLTELEKRS